MLLKVVYKSKDMAAIHMKLSRRDQCKNTALHLQNIGIVEKNTIFNCSKCAKRRDEERQTMFLSINVNSGFNRKKVPIRRIRLKILQEWPVLLITAIDFNQEGISKENTVKLNQVTLLKDKDVLDKSLLLEVSAEEFFTV